MKQKIQLTECQLRSLIKEAVQKAVNEISSDMLKRAKSGFSDKISKMDKDGNLTKDKWGNKLYPKDNRLVGDHLDNFDRAIRNAEHDEVRNGEDSIKKEAANIFDTVMSWPQEELEELGVFQGENDSYHEIDNIEGFPGWFFSWDDNSGGRWIGDAKVYFKSPDGEEGYFVGSKINMPEYSKYSPESGKYEHSYSKKQLKESDLRKIIKESIKKVINEISSDMIARANSKFYQKYGGTHFPGPDAKDFPKDKSGNLLYPKDMKPLAQHYRNFNDAYDRAKRNEEMSDPLIQQAKEIWNEVESDVDWDITDDFDNEGCEVTGYIEVDGWEFSASGYAEKAGGLEVEEIGSVEFKSPDGQEGSFRP